MLSQEEKEWTEQQNRIQESKWNERFTQYQNSELNSNNKISTLEVNTFLPLQNPFCCTRHGMPVSNQPSIQALTMFVLENLLYTYLQSRLTQARTKTDVLQSERDAAVAKTKELTQTLDDREKAWEGRYAAFTEVWDSRTAVLHVCCVGVLVCKESGMAVVVVLLLYCCGC